MAKARGKSNANNKPDEKKGRFTDPTIDAMRKIGNGFRVIDNLDETDQVTVLRWVKQRFLSKLDDIET